MVQKILKETQEQNQMEREGQRYWNGKVGRYMSKGQLVTEEVEDLKQRQTKDTKKGK